jgi:putative addiction module component
MSTVDDVLSVALSLPVGDRAAVAERLLASLDVPLAGQSNDIDQLWAKEITARLEAYQRGEIKSRPWREALDDVRQRLAVGRAE